MNRKIEVDFRTDGYGNVFVELETIKGNLRDFEKVEYLYDSGATVTVLAYNDLLNLGFTEEKLNSFPISEVPVRLADNTYLSLYYITNMQVKLEDRNIQRITVYFHPRKKEYSLLGNNILKYFNRAINYDKNLLTLVQRDSEPKLTGNEKPIQIYSLQNEL